jgi:hypothetical protein
MPTLEQDVQNFLAPVEKEAVMLWDDFLKGINYLSKEAALIAKWVEGVDPGIQKQIQDFITVGENAATLLVAKGNPAIANFITTGVDAAEQGAANFIQKVTGNSALGVSASALVTAGISDLGAITSSVATVGFTRAVAGLAAAAAPLSAVAALAPAPSAPTG